TRGADEYSATGAGRVGTLTRRRSSVDSGPPASRGRGRRGRRDTGDRGGPPRSDDRAGTTGPFGRHPVLSIIAIAATLGISGAAIFFYGLYRNVYDSIHHVNVTNAMLGKRPPNLSPGSLNILVIGSDSRAGIHGYGHVTGARSDTSMLLHITPNHQHVTV